MFQPPNNFDCLLLDSFLYVSVCLVMESAKLHLILQMWPEVQNRGIPLFGICNFFPADYKLAHIGQDVTKLFSEDTPLSLVPSSPSTSTFFSARYCILSTFSLYCCMEFFYCSCMTLHLPLSLLPAFFSRLLEINWVTDSPVLQLINLSLAI